MKGKIKRKDWDDGLWINLQFSNMISEFSLMLETTFNVISFTLIRFAD